MPLQLTTASTTPRKASKMPQDQLSMPNPCKDTFKPPFLASTQEMYDLKEPTTDEWVTAEHNLQSIPLGASFNGELLTPQQRLDLWKDTDAKVMTLEDLPLSDGGIFMGVVRYIPGFEP